MKTEFLIIALLGDDFITAQKVLELAIAELDKLNPEEKFTVKDLFLGYEWNRVPKNIRLTLGTLFLNFATESDLIIVLGKNSQNQQLYKKND